VRDYRDDKKKKRKPEVRVCLYCGINTVRESPYCCKACERYDQEYREWLKSKEK
jgi:hypothetical protein